MCVKFLANVLKNESYYFFANICKPNLAYFASILQKLPQNENNFA
jgi:hypothetical protein